MSAPGFGAAPVSKGMFTLTLAASLALSLVRRSFGLDLTAIVTRKEVWRVFTAPLVSPLPTELLLSLVLLYSFRLFERTNGSRKFAGSLLFLVVVNTALNLLLLWATKSPEIASGPYWLIFGLFVQYFADIPQSTRFRLFNMSLGLSDKTLVYLMGLQLLFAKGTASLLAGATGVVSGVLYRAVPAFSALRPPAWLTRCCVRFCAPLLGSSQPRSAAAMDDDAAAPNAGAGGYAQVPQMNNADAPAGFGGAVGAAAGAGADAMPFGAASAADLVEPTEENVQQLLRLGFDEARARQALAQSGNSVAIATARLVDA